ncbi:olfactory receptor 10AG1-like [Trichosurus vulpecula]|uniref:olfactory receptor 10AG1-like n=1 Tax=Trichosurus vulpecula TaxID=9337 RepID=UPI00186B156B|nr:olfactory receptor 10AG1-like [Trichosurus vulpecula]
MAETNLSHVKEFIILGFSDLPNLQDILFGIFLYIYINTLIGNGLIIVITKSDAALQTPMYFFLGNFAFLEICYTSVTLPRMLSDIWTQNKNISLLACAAQLCFFLILVVTESLLLTVMAFDRYVAICKPLYYTVIMNHKMCVQLVVASWITVVPIMVVQTFQVFSLPFCDSNILNHIFCDMPPLMKLACGDKSWNEVLVYAEVSLFGFIPFLLILYSYIRIFITIQKLPSAIGRSKAFSTCSSHLMVVGLFYGSGIIAYLQPKTSCLAGMEKMLSLFYTIITPMFNPLIYSLRNKDIIMAMKKLLSK